MMNLGMLSGRGLLSSRPGMLGGGMPTGAGLFASQPPMMSTGGNPGGGFPMAANPGMMRTGWWNPSGASPMQNPVMPVPQAPTPPAGMQGMGTRANPYILGGINLQKGMGDAMYDRPYITPA